MKIQTQGLKRKYSKHSDEYMKEIEEVLFSGSYILGDKVKQFESEFSSYLGVPYVIGVASGLDAIKIACRTLGIGSGDEVIMAANVYSACALAVTAVGAKPVLVDCNRYKNIDITKIENAITKNTKAIMAVHMFGQSCNMDAIWRLANKYCLYVIEDCSQAHGAIYGNQKVGAQSDIACFSFFPTKNLGAFGDGGCIATRNDLFVSKCQILRNYGQKDKGNYIELGYNSRLDEIQAAILKVGLKHLEENNTARQRIAERYLQEINNKKLILPETQPLSTNVWHQFVVECENRDEMCAYLKENGIETLIHYPKPFYLCPAFEYLGYKQGDFPNAEKLTFSLPIYPELSYAEQSRIIKLLNEKI